VGIAASFVVAAIMLAAFGLNRVAAAQEQKRTALQDSCGEMTSLLHSAPGFVRGLYLCATRRWDIADPPV